MVEPVVTVLVVPRVTGERVHQEGRRRRVLHVAAPTPEHQQAESGQPLWPGTPKLRSTTLPGGQKPEPAPPPAPVFEDVDQQRLKGSVPPAPAASPHPELAPRPRDFAATVQNLKRRFGLTPSGNPKLVKLLDSGQIQGLRPLRYERRVARNRFFLLFALLLAVLYGLFKAIVGSR